MRYVFLGLMCAFAVSYASIKFKGSLAARIALKSIASICFVMIAFVARLDAPQPYFTLILMSLCLSLAGDVLLVLPGTASLAAGGSVFLLAHMGFIAAFFVYSPLSWIDAALWIGFAVLAAVLFMGKTNGLGRLKPFIFIYAFVLSALAAKAIQMLFVRDVNPTCAAFAALGGMLTVLSDAALGYARTSPGENRGMSVFATLSYYAAQAFLALSVVL